MNSVGRIARTIFWSESQQRLRVLWRFLLTFTLVGIIVNVLAWLVERIDYGAAGGFLERPLTNVVIALALIGTLAITGRYLDRRTLADYGLQRNPAFLVEFLLGGFAALAAMFLVCMSLLGLRWVEITGQLVVSDATFAFGVAFGIQLIRYFAGSVLEELTMRGYLFRLLAESLGGPLGRRLAVLLTLLITSSIFGLGHMANPNATATGVVNLILIGLLFGIPLVLTGRLSYSIGLHLCWNVGQNLVFGLPNSGQAAPVTIIATRAVGPEWWTGAAFGLEGGVAGTLAAIIALGLTLFVIAMREGGLQIDTSLADATQHCREPGETERSPTR